MHESAGRTANLLGAAAVTVADWSQSAAADAAGTSVSGAAALITLADEPGIGVTELGARIGLSQPAAARMLDALAADDLVRRSRAGRTVQVRLTRRGRTAAARALQARGTELRDVVDRLDPADREALERGLEALLAAIYDGAGSEHVVCRLCDRETCLSRGRLCPVGQAARAARAAPATEAHG